MDEVRPFLLGPAAVDLNRLYGAWVLATHGRDAVWIEQHLHLPTEAARLLTAAAGQWNGDSPRL